MVADDLLQLGKKLESEGKYEEARRAYEKSADLVLSYIQRTYELENSADATQTVRELRSQVQINLEEIRSGQVYTTSVTGSSEDHAFRSFKQHGQL